MGIIYFVVVNSLLLFLILSNYKNAKYQNNNNTDKKLSFSVIVFIIVVTFHLIYFFIYFYTNMQIWVYGNTINSFSDVISYLNRDNGNLINTNIHDIIEKSLGGHSKIEKVYQLEILNKAFENYYHPVSMNEDPEPSFIFLFFILKFFFPKLVLMDFYIFIFAISILSIHSIVISIKRIINRSASVIFLILSLFYIPYFNGLFALYHHILIISAFAIYLKYLELFILKKNNFYVYFILSILLCFLISCRSSLIIFIPVILFTNFYTMRSKIEFSKLSFIFVIFYLLIQSITINGQYNKGKDGIKYGSHVLWYTFFTGLGETKRIISNADDGIGYELAREKIPEKERMSKDWDNYFKQESFRLIRENKKDYFNLILYRINKVYHNQSNWRIFNINNFKIKGFDYFFSVIYLFSIVSLVLTFFINKKSILIKGFLMCLPLIVTSNLHILIFAKNFYYYLLHPFIYFTFISVFLSAILIEKNNKDIYGI